MISPSAGGLEEEPSPRLVAEARIDEHASPLEDESLGPAQALGVGPLVPLGRVELFAECAGAESWPLRPASSLRTTSERITVNPARSARSRARVDLPGPGQAGDEHQAGPAAGLLQLGEGEEPEGTGAGPGRGPVGLGDLRLRELHAFDLAAHRGAIGPIERQQHAALLVARGAEIRLDERPGEVAAALERQLHGEEGDVGDRVGVAEPLVEFDAVDHDPVVRADCRSGNQ